MNEAEERAGPCVGEGVATRYCARNRFTHLNRSKSKILRERMENGSVWCLFTFSYLTVI